MRVVLQDATDDCLRAAICSVLELEPAEYADYVSSSNWYGYWAGKLELLGFALIEGSAAYQAARNSGYWIGMPPSLHEPGGHAIVMRGRELVLDPGRRRPCYDQDRVDEWLAGSPSSALLLVPHDPARAR